jgi:regulatory protein
LRKRPRKRSLAPGQCTDGAAAGAAAVMLLSRRDFCSGELRQTLVAQGFEPVTAQAVVDEFIERGYVNDERFAQQYVSLHAERGQGPLRIRRELELRGLEAALIAATLEAGEDWAQRAREVRIRRFGLAMPTDWPSKAKQARFLQYRGFSTENIRSALGSEVADA